MSNWSNKKWGDIATLEYGKSLRGYENGNGSIPVFGTNGPIGWCDKPLYHKPSVIIGRKGAYRGIHYSATPFFVIDTAFYLKPKPEYESKIDTKWAYYQLLTQDINSLDSGSAIPSTSREDFYSLKVFLPSIEEQRQIVEVLGSLDDKIELNRRMNRTLEAMARALFQSWFVDFDPVHAKARGETPYGMDEATAALFPDSFEETGVGRVPRGWQVKPLDKIAEYLNGLALQKYPPQGDDFLPVIKIRELRQGFVNESSDKAGTYLKSQYIIEDGDILFSWSGSLLVDIWCGGRGALNQHLFKVTSSQYPKWFYYFWTLHHLDEFVRIAAHKATTMGHIQRQHLSSALTIVPPIELIEAGTEFIGSLLEQIITNRLETRNLATLRDTLLPKLVSGELPVPLPIAKVYTTRDRQIQKRVAERRSFVYNENGKNRASQKGNTDDRSLPQIIRRKSTGLRPNGKTASGLVRGSRLQRALSPTSIGLRRTRRT
jgi:type I restriction enzyme S subunit